MRDLPAFIEGLHDYIGKALAPLLEKIDGVQAVARGLSERFAGVNAELDEHAIAIAEITKRAPVKGDKGEDGPTLEEVLPPLLEAARSLLDPVALELKNDAALLTGEVRQQITDAIAAIQPPKDGEDGEDGEDGKSVSVEDVLAALAPHIEKRMAEWETQAERRFFDFCERAIQNMPKPKDGADGLKLSDGVLEFDGKRTYTLTLKDGESEMRSTVKIPAILDAGYWQEGMKCEAGDMVTCGGSAWIAQRDTMERPEIGKAEDWRLAVRKGRDARHVDFPKPEAKPVRLGAVE